METSESNGNQLAEYVLHVEVYPGYTLKVRPRPMLDGKNEDGTNKFIIFADINIDTPDGPFTFIMRAPEKTFQAVVNRAKANGTVVKMMNLFQTHLPGFGFRPITSKMGKK